MEGLFPLVMDRGDLTIGLAAPLDVTRAVPLGASPLLAEVTLAVDMDDLLARLEGFAPETLALDWAARFERSALDVTFFAGATIQPTAMVATGILKPVPDPR
jgi:hypothetical protein